MIVNNNHNHPQRNPPRTNIQEEERKVYDNIHGFIRFQKRIWYFIDTPQFQKLRYIKQLGVLSHVFPGATHTRFQHCLGTGHLAKTFITLLIEKNPQRYADVSQKQKQSAIFTVTLAGIMHDIGHGPFSHTFDGQIVKTKVLQKDSTKQGKQWCHQIGSELIFRHIVKKYSLIQKQAITKEQVQRVVKLIHGKQPDNIRPWEYELISNKQTGIDVDKLDYFRRDAFYLGAKGVLIDHDLLMNQARILYDDKAKKSKYTIGYPSKYALQVNDIFYSRYKLYKTYYLNNISKGVQFMIMDVLKLVQPIFQFTKICENIKQRDQWIDRYVNLTDGILQRVQWLDQNQQKCKQWKENIIEAKKILLRLKQRKIYKFVREVQTSITLQRVHKYKDVLLQIFNKDNIAKFIQNKTGISKQQFHIAVTQAGYGFKHLNPLNKVKFFRKQNFLDNDQRYKPLDQQQFRAENISILYTKAFAQRYAKLYVKNVQEKDRENIKKINLAFTNYFDVKKSQCGEDIFNHLNMGRTSFIPTDFRPDNFGLRNYEKPNHKENQQSLP